MLKVGITGGIGSGKSFICNIFKALDVPVFDADFEAKELLKSDLVIDFYKKEFGEKVFTKNSLDHSKIAALIFENKEIIKKINHFIHPLVFECFDNWCKAYNTKPYVIKEAALLFESGAHKTLDYTILVCAPEETRIQRVMQRSNLNREQVLVRIRNQWTDEEKIKLASTIIDNNENTPILQKIIDTHNHILNQ